MQTDTRVYWVRLNASGLWWLLVRPVAVPLFGVYLRLVLCVSPGNSPAVSVCRLSVGVKEDLANIWK